MAKLPDLITSRRGFLKTASAAAGTSLVIGCAPNDVVERTSAKSVATLLFSGNDPIKNRWGYESRHEAGETFLWQGVDIVVDPGTLKPNRHNLIFGYSVTFKGGSFVSRGRDILVFAKHISFEAGAIIDVAGDPGSAPAEAPLVSMTPGDNGKPGAEKHDGQKGGSVTIAAESANGALGVYAGGGAGGRGQDGGRGAAGQSYADGRDGNCYGTNPERGRDGGPGGTGGDGAEGGVGGAGGMIRIAVMSTWSEANANVDGGTGGMGGKGGAGAPGGPGSRGGRQAHEGGKEGTRCIRGDRLPSGQTGPTGHDGNNGKEGATGAAGSVTVTHADEARAFLASRASLMQLGFVVRSAELAYLNEQHKRAAEMLHWVLDLTSVPLSGNPHDATARGTAAIELPYQAQAERDGLRARCVILLDQLSRGFDYFGAKPDAATVVAPEEYDAAVQRLIQIGKSLQAQSDGYWKQRQANDTARDQLRNAVRSIEGEQQALESELRIIAEKLAAQSAEIDKQTQSLEQQVIELRNLDERFQRAVARQGACSFLDMVTFVASVVSVAAGAYENLATMVEEFGKPRQGGLGEPSEGHTTWVKVLKTVRPGVGSFKDAYTQLKGELADISRSTTKLIVQQEDFEQQLEPYLDLAEAHELRNAMREFVSTATSRNEMMVFAQSLETQSAATRAEIAKRRVDASRLIGEIADTHDAALMRADSFMLAALDRCKQTTMRMLHSQRRALDLWLLENNRLSFNDERIESLESTYGDLSTERISGLQRRNRAPQPFDPVVDVILADSKSDVQWNVFRKTRRLAFTISPDHAAFFERAGAAALFGVDARVEGIRTSANLVTLRLTHSGTSNFVKPDRSKISFQHPPRTTTLTYRPNAPLSPSPISNLGGQEARFAYLSPFSSWTLEALVPSGQQVDLQRVRRVVLRFSGQFLPFTGG